MMCFSFLVPSRPQRLIDSVVTSDSITISWDPPATTGDFSRGYYNIYVERTGSPSAFLFGHQYSISNLQPATLYTIEVAATTSNGGEEGERSEITVTTRPIGI